MERSRRIARLLSGYWAFFWSFFSISRTARAMLPRRRKAAVDRSQSRLSKAGMPEISLARFDVMARG